MLHLIIHSMASKECHSVRINSSMNAILMDYYKAYAEVIGSNKVADLCDPHREKFYDICIGADELDYETQFLTKYNEVKEWHLEAEVFSEMRERGISIWQAASEWDL